MTSGELYDSLNATQHIVSDVVNARCGHIHRDVSLSDITLVITTEL